MKREDQKNDVNDVRHSLFTNWLLKDLATIDIQCTITADQRPISYPCKYAEMRITNSAVIAKNDTKDEIVKIGILEMQVSMKRCSAI